MGYYDDWLPEDWKRGASKHSICWIVVASQPDVSNEYSAFANVLWQNVVACSVMISVFLLLCSGLPARLISGCCALLSTNWTSNNGDQQTTKLSITQRLKAALDYSSLSRDAVYYLAFQACLFWRSPQKLIDNFARD